MLSGVLVVVIGIYSFLGNASCLVISTDGVVTAQDTIEGIEWLHCSRQGGGCFLGSSWR